MSQSFPQTLIVDIGRAWTKSFLVQEEDGTLVITKKLSLPTSSGDLAFTYNGIISKLKVAKETPIIVTGSLPEIEVLVKTIGANYVTEEDAKKSFLDFLEKNNFRKSILLDAGDYSFSPGTKITQLGAFLSEDASEIDIENYFGNKSLNPRWIPNSDLELDLEEAFLRLAFASNRNFLNAGNFINIVLTGSFVSLSPRKSRLGLIMADILSSGRVAQVKVDNELFAHSFGALLKVVPKAEELKISFLSDLGAFIAFGGGGKIMLDWGFTEKQEISVVEDEIAIVPAKEGQEVKVTFLDSKEKFKITLRGGRFGLLLDGRLKPLPLAFGRIESREAIKRWNEAIDKVEILS